ncbi:hypothetical protein RED65_00930 [Oceanobacter sp. RED65]|uniref:Uncharacterized protein n=1 Tax=Bermanella marisrubri TaxID=207949 RepID=Q1N4Z8_9GAMM|nr:hypothetical protein RED65_00930 [Oceanobacter sp. RED65] [Bermanella marisrubri]
MNDSYNDKKLIFDHMYYRQPDSPLGVDWEEFEQRSFEKFPNNYLT